MKPVDLAFDQQRKSKHWGLKRPKIAIELETLSKHLE